MKRVSVILTAGVMILFGTACSQNPETANGRSGLSADDYIAADGTKYQSVMSLEEIEDDCTGHADLGKVYYVQNINALMACKYIEDGDDVIYDWAEISITGKDGKDGKDGEDGIDGQDGKSSVIEQRHLAVGDDNCANGGTLIVSYLDVNGNLEFDQDTDSNIQMTYLCENSGDTDRDNDGVDDFADNCPLMANADQADRDNDTVGDVCDNLPDQVNPNQLDVDKDGIADVQDNCKLYPNANQTDSNDNGKGDLCDRYMIPSNIVKLLTTGACTSCNLKGADFSAVDFAKISTDNGDDPIDLSGANLTNTDFSDGALDNALFIGAGIEGADFSDASLKQADFTDAIQSATTEFDGADTTGAVGL